MDIRKVDSRSNWADKLVEASRKKFASREVTSGSVSCPLSNSVISSKNCELCSFCVGNSFSVSAGKDSIECSYGFQKEASLNEAKTTEGKECVKPEDLKGFFAKDERTDFTEADILSNKSVTASLSNDEFKYDGNIISANTNSIFNSEALSQLEQDEINKEAELADVRAKEEKIRLESKKSWDTDAYNRLANVGYTPDDGLKNTTSSTEGAVATNPEVSEYNLSIFDSNLKSKIDSIPEKTAGEKLKSLSEERKRSISRDVKRDSDWESVSPQNSYKDIEDSFMDIILPSKTASSEKEDVTSDIGHSNELKTQDGVVEDYFKSIFKQ